MYRNKSLLPLPSAIYVLNSLRIPPYRYYMCVREVVVFPPSLSLFLLPPPPFKLRPLPPRLSLIFHSLQMSSISRTVMHKIQFARGIGNREMIRANTLPSLTRAKVSDYR